MAEVDTTDNEIIPARCRSSAEEVTGHLATLSVNGADDGEAEEEIVYAAADYTGMGEDQVRSGDTVVVYFHKFRYDKDVDQ